jgi:hypothetical protein
VAEGKKEARFFKSILVLIGALKKRASFFPDAGH